MVKLFLVGLVFVSFAESYLFPGNDISLVHVVKKIVFPKTSDTNSLQEKYHNLSSG